MRKHSLVPKAGPAEWEKSSKPIRDIGELGFGYSAKQRKELGLKQERVPGSRADDSSRMPATGGRVRSGRKPGKRKPEHRRKSRMDPIRERIEKEQRSIAHAISDRDYRKAQEKAQGEKDKRMAKEMERRKGLKSKAKSGAKKWRKGVMRKTTSGAVRHRLKKRKLY